MTKITFSLKPYKIPFINKQLRSFAIIQVTDDKGLLALGEIAPLPNFSKETLEEALQQLSHKEKEISNISWSLENCFLELKKLNLFPSVLFGLETALLSLLDPLPSFTLKKSALFMGSFEEILIQAKKREKEGYRSAKLKTGNLPFKEARDLILLLKDRFSLRIDVNRAWEEKKALSFFEEFPLGTFDYVEEPYKNPSSLSSFTHPLAVDESFPSSLSLKDLESLPSLKALIYKPVIQGGMTHAIPLATWAKKRGIDLILSSCFETSIGLNSISSIAKRLSLSSPIGTGTSHFLPCPFQDKIVQS